MMDWLKKLFNRNAKLPPLTVAVFEEKPKNFLQAKKEITAKFRARYERARAQGDAAKMAKLKADLPKKIQEAQLKHYGQ
jgi:hypothetical protein